MIGAIGFGQLAERIGRIPAIMITTAVFAVGGIASAFAWGFLSMQVIRFVQGLGLGAEVPIAATYINEIAPAERRGRFVLLYEILFAIGLLLAGVIGRWIIPDLGLAIAVSPGQRAAADCRAVDPDVARNRRAG